MSKERSNSNRRLVALSTEKIYLLIIAEKKGRHVAQHI